MCVVAVLWLRLQTEMKTYMKDNKKNLANVQKKINLLSGEMNSLDINISKNDIMRKQIEDREFEVLFIIINQSIVKEI